MRVELAEEDDGMKTSIALKLWVEDPRRLKGKYRDGGAIEFSFDLEKEVPEAVAQEMVRVLLTSPALPAPPSSSAIRYTIELHLLCVMLMWTTQI